MDAVLFDTAQRIFNDHNNDAAALWTALETNELTKAWIPESLGGHALTADNVFGLIELSATSHASSQFAETLFASWLLSASGLDTPNGKLGFSIDGDDTAVTCGTGTSHVVTLDDASVSLYDATVCSVVPSIGEDDAATMDLTRSTPVVSAARPTWLDSKTAFACAAQLRAVQLVGAASAALELTLEYAAQREQFGRSLSRFQAIQHLLSETAAEVAAATAACEASVDSINHNGVPTLELVAIAKQRASEAAGTVAEHCHQVHGAIGYTQDYPLARYTRRLWQWRDDYGDQHHWAEYLGQQYLRQNNTLWAHLTSLT